MNMIATKTRFTRMPVRSAKRLISLPQSMDDDIRVVFESRDRRACSDRSLVLASLEIPHDVVVDGMGYVLIVPASHSSRAAEELRLYDMENPPPRPRQLSPFVHQNAIPGVIAYVIIISLISIIFIFKSVLMAFVSVPFVLFIDILEILVAFIQAFIFTMLTALFIGMAVQPAH